MIKSLSKTKKKLPAQAMVEFALALPVLLLLLYGTIEVSRLIFIYSSVSMAARQAVQFGAATGEINGVPFYENCDGIRAAANQLAFINTFDEINITYDRGVNPNGVQIPITSINPSPDVNTCPMDHISIQNGDRIIVQVSSTYKPILPIIPIQSFKIVAASARTVLVSIPIFGSALPTGFAAESSTPSRTPIASSTIEMPTSAMTSTPIRIQPSSIIPPSYGTSTSAPIAPTNPLQIATLTPPNTPLPINTPTIAPTQIQCAGQIGVTHGPLTISNNVMEMKINNTTGHMLNTAQIFVEWNNDRGHQSGSDTTLRLRQTLLATQVWNGDLQTPSTFIPGYTPIIPPGESTIQFIFHQTYDITDGTERIIIYISTPGCTNYLVDSMN